jgi:hypothetical protein
LNIALETPSDNTNGEETMTTLKIGQRVTLLKIDDMMAMSHRYELEVRSVLNQERVGYEGRKLRVATVRQKRKRKEFYLDLAHDDILLDGWNMPFKTDTECSGVFSGNACYNLVGDPDAIRQCLEERAVYPISDTAKAKVLVSPTVRTSCDNSGTIILYADIDTHHAVINRMKEQTATVPGVAK